MKSVAIICAQGLGDGLLMMIVAHQLKKAGCNPTVFHNHVEELSALFSDIPILPHPPLDQLEQVIASFDQVVIENDHSERAYHLSRLRKKRKHESILFFFPTPSPLFQKGDFVFDSRLPVASNLKLGCQKSFNIKLATKENGIQIPKGKIHRRFPKRIVIHPTSNDPKRNWSSAQFLSLARSLQKDGFTVSFSVSPNERKDWLHVLGEGFELPIFTNLAEVAAYLYESGFLIGNDSGIGHLASNLSIPTLTISGNPKRVRLWRPDWHVGDVVTLQFPLPNFKGINCRIRENFWQHFISVPRTLRAFRKLKKSVE
ncbi:glycosyltransferase family 9 protein [Simkania negevensis]|jgi:ADP-heptose:LPS heptosyltransferase|uniref:Uncharacterized protein n=1 Tax=Simkania negevensis (strain ATCC VR-1471 / DSM 27360 / Z) TaxID=331113 RepID=F8L6W0_SIMNZ|nr:glycosyltransferase family 9 protein [Simkania negevensis]CCB88463.1 putative uncharacterized protein [Simkania negevensis Z]